MNQKAVIVRSWPQNGELEKSELDNALAEGWKVDQMIESRGGHILVILKKDDE